MNIQNPLRKLLHEPGREQPHVSGQADEIDVVLREGGDDFAVVFFAGLAFGRNHQSIQPALTRDGNPRRIGPVRNDDCDARVRNAARINAVGDGDEVRPASGK